MRKISKILIISHGMRKKITIIGQSIYFTKIPFLCENNWSAYFFIGFGKAAEALILGIFLCTNKEKANMLGGDYKDFYFAFESFFDNCISLGIFPYSFQTDYNCNEATKALQSLVYYTKEPKIKEINHRYSCQSFF